MRQRKDTTTLLTDILVADRLADRRYFAREVTLDYGTDHVKRVDVMQFLPKGVIYVSDIEKGTFVCYEVKSCKEDLYSGSGLNFFGEKNYIIMTAQTYNSIKPDLENGTLLKYIKEYYPESSTHFGIMVPVPVIVDLQNKKEVIAELERPTKFGGAVSNWQLCTVMQCRPGHRVRSTSELLFCMLRSKHTNAH